MPSAPSGTSLGRSRMRRRVLRQRHNPRTVHIKTMGDLTVAHYVLSKANIKVAGDLPIARYIYSHQVA